MKAEIKHAAYRAVAARLDSLLEGETDCVAAMATIVCELHHQFEHFHWTGFYRRVDEALLKVGPYQGGHGCLSIDFSRGVCGRAAREAQTQIVADVNALPYHIACSSTTQSEIVVPVVDTMGRVQAVLDIDSNLSNQFDKVDDEHLTSICHRLSPLYT